MMYSFFLLDEPAPTWYEEHRSSIQLTGMIAVVALLTLLGIFIYRKKRKK